MGLMMFGSLRHGPDAEKRARWAETLSLQRCNTETTEFNRRFASFR